MFDYSKEIKHEKMKTLNIKEILTWTPLAISKRPLFPRAFPMRPKRIS